MSSPLSWPKDEKDANAGPGVRPMQIRVAVILMYAGAAVTAVQPIWWLMMPRADKEELAESGLKAAKQKATPEEIALYLDRGTWVILVMSAIAIALWILIAAMNNRGKRWARAVATGLALTNIIWTFMLAQPSLHGMALVVIGLVSAGLLWMSKSREWFNGGTGAGRPLKV